MIHKHASVPNQEKENVFKPGQESVNLFPICNDIKQRKGEKILTQVFPNYKFKPGEVNESSLP